MIWILVPAVALSLYVYTIMAVLSANMICQHWPKFEEDYWDGFALSVGAFWPITMPCVAGLLTVRSLTTEKQPPSET
jgi:hypothetical protein